MTLTQLSYFRAVCQCDSVTQAARSLHISQPALSNSIKDLENEFGLNLFHRQNKHFVLTKEGEYFLSRITFVLDSYDELLTNMKSFATNKNDIKIGMPTFSGTFIAPPLIAEFRRLHPEIKFDIQELPSFYTAQSISSGLLDVGFVNTNVINTAPFDVYPLYTVASSFCVRRDNPLSAYRELSLENIGGHPLVLITTGHYEVNNTISRFRNIGIEPNVLLCTSQYSAAIKYVRLGVAGAFIWRELVRGDDELVSIPVTDIDPSEIALIVRKSSHMYASTAKFITFVQNWRAKHANLGGLLK